MRQIKDATVCLVAAVAIITVLAVLFWWGY